jgi:hypothetical protein
LHRPTAGFILGYSYIGNILQGTNEMSHTVQAEINVDGSIRLLEPIYVDKPTRALVTLIDGEYSSVDRRGNVTSVLKFLRENRLPDAARPTQEEIENQIAEARESWD